MRLAPTGRPGGRPLRAAKLQNILPLAALQVTPHGAHVPKVSNHLGNDLQDVIHFLVGVVLAQRKPQGAMGHVVNPADGQQHMAGIQRAGGAGGAGGGADPVGIQQKQQALALDALEAEADVARQTVLKVTVDGAVGNLAQAFDEPVPHGGDPGHVLVDVVAGILHGGGHAADAGQILGTGPLAPLLGAALNDIDQREAPADIQGAHALGAVELVSGQAQHVDVLLFDVDFQVADGLNGVGVEGHAGLLADGADFRDGQHGADLVVGVHGGHQAGVGTDGVLHLLGGDVVIVLHIQIGDLKAFLFQLCQGVQHSVVLKGGGDNVLLALARAEAGGGKNRLIVGLAAAGGEDDLSRLTTQALSNGGPGGVQGFLGLLTHGVQGRGVAVDLVQVGQHGVDGHLRSGGGGRVVGVNSHNVFLHRYLPSNSMGNIAPSTYIVNR